MQKQLKHFCCFPNTAALSCVLLVFFVKRIQIYFPCSVHCLLGVCCWWTIKWWQNRHNVFDFFIFELKIFFKKYFLLWPSFKSIRRYLLFSVLWLRYLRFLENTYSIFWLRITTIGEDFFVWLIGLVSIWYSFGDHQNLVLDHHKCYRLQNFKSFILKEVRYLLNS